MASRRKYFQRPCLAESRAWPQGSHSRRHAEKTSNGYSCLQSSRKANVYHHVSSCCAVVCSPAWPLESLTCQGTTSGCKYKYTCTMKKETDGRVGKRSKTKRRTGTTASTEPLEKEGRNGRVGGVKMPIKPSYLHLHSSAPYNHPGPAFHLPCACVKIWRVMIEPIGLHSSSACEIQEKPSVSAI